MEALGDVEGLAAAHRERVLGRSAEVPDEDFVVGPAVGNHPVRRARRHRVANVILVAPPHGEGVAAVAVPVADEHDVARFAVGDRVIGGRRADPVGDVEDVASAYCERVLAVAVPVAHIVLVAGNPVGGGELRSRRGRADVVDGEGVAPAQGNRVFAVAVPVAHNLGVGTQPVGEGVGGVAAPRVVEVVGRGRRLGLGLGLGRRGCPAHDPLVLGRRRRPDLIEVPVDRAGAGSGLDVLVSDDAGKGASRRKRGAGASRNRHRASAVRIDAAENEARGNDVGEGFADERRDARRRTVGAQNRDPEGALVAGGGMRAGHHFAVRGGQGARAALPTPAVLVDEDVVSDVAPSAGDRVVAVDAPNSRRHLRLAVVVRPRRVMDNRALKVLVRTRPRHLPLVGSPCRARVDAREVVGGGDLRSRQLPRRGRIGLRRSAGLALRRGLSLRGGRCSRAAELRRRGYARRFAREDRPLLVGVGDRGGQACSRRLLRRRNLLDVCDLFGRPLAVDEVDGKPGGKAAASLDADLNARRSAGNVGLRSGAPVLALFDR